MFFVVVVFSSLFFVESCSILRPCVTTNKNNNNNTMSIATHSTTNTVTLTVTVSNEMYLKYTSGDL